LTTVVAQSSRNGLIDGNSAIKKTFLTPDRLGGAIGESPRPEIGRALNQNRQATVKTINGDYGVCVWHHQ
jgi:hypothetical protein